MADNDDHRGHSNGNLECSLCLSPFANAATTVPCGHTFCTDCIIKYWQSKDASFPIDCPLDRQHITMIIPNYVIRNEINRVAQDRNKDTQNDDQRLINYNDKFAHLPRAFGQHLREDTYLLRLAYNNTSTYRWAMIGLIILGVLYLVSPVDIIPDSLGAIGFVDDFVIWVVVTLLLYELAQRYREYLLGNINRRGNN